MCFLNEYNLFFCRSRVIYWFYV